MDEVLEIPRYQTMVGADLQRMGEGFESPQRPQAKVDQNPPLRGILYQQKHAIGSF